MSCGPIYDISQAFGDPRVKHLRMTRPARHPVLGAIGLLSSPTNLSSVAHPEQFHHAAPAVPVADELVGTSKW